jgi:hypothetical protein
LKITGSGWPAEKGKGLKKRLPENISSQLQIADFFTPRLSGSKKNEPVNSSAHRAARRDPKRKEIKNGAKE